jgi:hypothetical protein
MLKPDCGAYSVPWRAEDDERFVAAELDEPAVRIRDSALDDVGEGGVKTRRRLIAVLLRLPRVATNVGDQKRPDPRFRRTREGIFDVQGRSARRKG